MTRCPNPPEPEDQTRHYLEKCLIPTPHLLGCCKNMGQTLLGAGGMACRQRGGLGLVVPIKIPPTNVRPFPSQSGFVVQFEGVGRLVKRGLAGRRNS